MEFGPLLRKLRLDAGYGLRQFAELIGELPSNLSAVEHGRRSAWRVQDKLQKAADALGLSEGTDDWDRFFLAARPSDALSGEIDRLVDSPQRLAMLRTVEELQLSDEQIEKLIRDLKSGKLVNARRRSNRRAR